MSRQKLDQTLSVLKKVQVQPAEEYSTIIDSERSLESTSRILKLSQSGSRSEVNLSHTLYPKTVACTNLFQKYMQRKYSKKESKVQTFLTKVKQTENANSAKLIA